MEHSYFDILYEKTDFSQTGLPKGDYENCSFLNCIFSQTDLSNINFSDCSFRDCDLSLAKVNHTAFRNITFRGCKLLGIHFDQCNAFLFSAEFLACKLDHSSFFRLQIKKTKFKDCSLVEVDFSEADLSYSLFDHCELRGATFQNSNLEKADLRSAYNYSIDPELNRIKKAKFSAAGLAGLLDRHDIDID